MNNIKKKLNGKQNSRNKYTQIEIALIDLSKWNIEKKKKRILMIDFSDKII